MENLEVKKFIEDMGKLYDITNPERLEIFEIDQLKVILEGLMLGIEGVIEYFVENCNYNAYQMSQIVDGMAMNLDYTIYAKPEFPWELMMSCKHLLIEGFIPITVTIDPDTDWMELLRVNNFRDIIKREPDEELDYWADYGDEDEISTCNQLQE